jgi:hypothetical protein
MERASERGGGQVSLDFILDRLTSVQVGGFWALVQVIIYAIAIYLGLVIATSLSDKRARRREGER